MNKEQFRIQDGGRVKMAGGSVSTYYDRAEPMVTQGLSGASETAAAFRALKDKPPLSLLLAFFPDDQQNIKRRLRGAGLYRHLRMDQGPGGNFTAFELGGSHPLDYTLTKESGFALPEYQVSSQLETGLYPALIPVIDSIQKAFSRNDYRKTAELVEQFQAMSMSLGLCLPTGEHVGSKTGFFFIRPTETDKDVHFPLELLPQVEVKVQDALEKPVQLAATATRLIKSGMTFDAAVQSARQTYNAQNSMEAPADELGLLYFQPDCFVDKSGRVVVEKVNVPDVGLFLTELNTQGNIPLSRVQEVNNRLKQQIELVLCNTFPGNTVTVVTRDEVVKHNADSLELLEIRALRKSLEQMGKQVKVKTLSDRSLSVTDQILLLNVSTDSTSFKEFATFVTRNEVTCFPNPLLKAFEDEMTTLRQIPVTGRQLEKFLQLIKPKEINDSNAERIHAEVIKYLDAANITEDILYVTINGLQTPLPVFRYSIHSFMQIYNAVEKEERAGRPVKKVVFSPVPFHPTSAVFKGKDGARLSAFRFMCTRTV